MTPSWLPRAGGIVPTGVPDGPLQEEELFASSQRALERARAEYEARRYDDVQKQLDELLAPLRDRAGNLDASRATDYALLYASALVLRARLHWRLAVRDRASSVAAHEHRQTQDQLFADALTLFRQHEDAIPKHPVASRLHTDFGIALYRTGSLRDAAETLRKALATGVPPVEAFAYLGMSLSNLGWSNKDPACYPEAIRELRKGLQLAPRDQVLLETLAITQERAGEKQHAVRTWCQAAIEAGTDGDAEAAREFLTSARRVAPDDPQALCMLTLLLQSQDRQSDALRLLERTLEQFPKHSWALALRGRIRQSEGKTEQALEDFAAVEVDGPSLAWVWLEHAKALASQDPKGAEVLVDRAAKLLEPDDKRLQDARFQVGAAVAVAGMKTYLQPKVAKLADTPFIRSIGDAIFPGVLDRVGLWARQNDLDGLRAIVERQPEEAEPRQALGELLLDRGEYAAAAEQFLQATRIAPARAEARMGLARAHLASKQFANAEAVLDEALALEPENVSILRLRVRAASDQGKLGEAMHFRFRAFRLMPASSQAFEDLVKAVLQAGQDTQGLRAVHHNDLELLRAAVAERPRHADGREALGILLFAHDRLDGALLAFAEAIGLAPERTDAREWLVCVQLACKDYEAASQAIAEGLKRTPEAATLLRLQGDVLARLGEPVEALSFYLRAVRAAPADDAAFEALVQGLLEAGREDEALLEVERKLKAAPGHGRALLHQARLLQRLGRAEESLASLEKAEQALTDPAALLEARIALGNALLHRNESAAASTAFDRAITVDNDIGDARAHKALLLLDTAEYGPAAEMLQEAMKRLSEGKEEHKARTGWLLNARGWALYCDGRTDMAELAAIFERSDEVMPNSPYARQNLARVLLRLDGRREDGLSILDELTELGSSQVPPHFTGWCHFRRGRFEAAEHWLEAASKAVPGSAAIAFDLSLTLLARGKPADDTYLQAKECARRHDLPRQRGLFHVALMDVTEAVRESVMSRDLLVDGWRELRESVMLRDLLVDRWRDLRESLIGAKFPESELAPLELPPAQYVEHALMAAELAAIADSAESAQSRRAAT